MCDASLHGIRPFFATSRLQRKKFQLQTLSTTEGTYAQIDKEALTITANIKKLHDYDNSYHDV
ncbi:hypothetical protein T4B_2575 [Trichinella pseudospiralis]|uniref:Uncharacterized protein n=1 Tax=Trichinella pseudospiralis TaxID=6337 RepID=A0A0V1GXL3_TRIPS|nr:hypothetical protein T4B_2575 [Trichinella pseudospiralis]